METNSTFETIEADARQQLADALAEYPRGCEEKELVAFLSRGRYPRIAYAIAMGWDYKTMINNELQKK